MRREDDYWTIEFGGQTCRLKDTKGLRYLVALLRRPHQPLAALVIERGAAAAAVFDADGGAAERARINVTRALNGAIRRLEAFNPALVRHLRATLRTGAQCIYMPDPRLPTTWDAPHE